MTQSTETASALLGAALALPNGARFYRCALQVNPYGYLIRHNKTSAFTNETEYNAAFIERAKKEGVEVIAVTDHYRFKDSISLIAAAREAGIFAFPAFEAVSKDGVHLLCLFDPEHDEAMERHIGRCGTFDASDLSPTGDKDAQTLMKEVMSWGGVCIAAHVAADQGGLLKKLSGETRAKTWKTDELLACSLPGTVDKAPQALRAILENKDAAHRRERPVAILNAQDLSTPDDISSPSATTLIKMSAPSIEGLRQAFLDPASRIRLNHEVPPEPHIEFLALAWEGGFLDGTKIRFNDNLNVLVGGRGAGKSTVIESLRFVLDLLPLGAEARTTHKGFVTNVLRAGTKISLLVRSPHPSTRTYTIERTVPDAPIVRSEAGQILKLKPKDIVPDAEIYGQHEISELTRSPEKLTQLLSRFIDAEADAAEAESSHRDTLHASRVAIVETQRLLSTNEERLATLPKLEEDLKRYQALGLEEKLKVHTSLDAQEETLNIAASQLIPLKTSIAGLSTTAFDLTALSDDAANATPHPDLVQEARRHLDELSKRVAIGQKQLQEDWKCAADGIAALLELLKDRRKPTDLEYQKLLRELQKDKIDASVFVRLRRDIAALKPISQKQQELRASLADKIAARAQLVASWADHKAAKYRVLEKAAKSVSRKLANKVRVSISFSGDRMPLEELLKEHFGKQQTVWDRLREANPFSLQEFAAAIRSGKPALIEKYRLPPAGAEKLAQATAEQLMLIEELDLPATTAIELNVAADDQPPTWKHLNDLSTGQKATAVLLLLLLEADAPLVVDQPEDDLDNRFITDGVVPIVKTEKKRRQFIFSTHNANIPVLGDAELILGLTAAGDAAGGQATIEPAHMASIDAKPVRELLGTILEGGRAAFEMRRRKYGF